MRYLAEGFMNMSGPGGTPGTYDFNSTEPWGRTWQEKINDMSDVLERKADDVDYGNEVKKFEDSWSKKIEVKYRISLRGKY